MPALWFLVLGLFAALMVVGWLWQQERTLLVRWPRREPNTEPGRRLSRLAAPPVQTYRVAGHDVWPVTFGLPKERFRPPKRFVDKRHLWAPLLPGAPTTYIYEREGEYQDAYHDACFAVTVRKAGWDCLRHYEIVAQGCVPVFLDLPLAPESVCASWPRAAVQHILDLPYLVLPQLERAGVWYRDGHVHHHCGWDPTKFPGPKAYDLLARAWHRYALKHWTCEAVARHVLARTACPKPQRVLYLTTTHTGEYLGDLIQVGMARAVPHLDVWPEVPYLYADQPYDPNTLYGKGFGYHGALPGPMPPAQTREALLKGLAGDPAYDLVVLARPWYQRDEELERAVFRAYTKDRVVALLGDDVLRSQIVRRYGPYATLFAREINP